jgi:opacity protein-like surface antigen
MMIKQTLLATTIALAFSSNIAFADTLNDTDNHPHDNAYNVNVESEIFTYIGIRGGINSYDVGNSCSGTSSDATNIDSGSSESITDCGSFSHKEGFFGSPFIGLGYRQARWGVRGEFEANFYQNKEWKDSLGYTFSVTDQDDNTTQYWKPITAKLSAKSYMMNFYGDFYAAKNSVFYLMGGLGASHLELDVPFVSDYGLDDNGKAYINTRSNSESKTHFAYQVGIGAQYYPISHLGLDLGFRYQDLGKIQGLDVSDLQFYVGALTRF